MTAVPVRAGHGVLHLCRATGRGYKAACGAKLAGADLEVPTRRDWARAWRLERRCSRCEARRVSAHSEADLFR